MAMPTAGGEPEDLDLDEPRDLDFDTQKRLLNASSSAQIKGK